MLVTTFSPSDGPGARRLGTCLLALSNAGTKTVAESKIRALLDQERKSKRYVVGIVVNT